MTSVIDSHKSADMADVNEPIDSDSCARILANLPAYVFVLDRAARQLAYSNEALRWALGYPATVGTESLPEQLVHPEDWEQLDELADSWNQAPSRTTLDIELRLKALDGTWHWFVARGRPFVRDQAGTVTKILAVAPDVGSGVASHGRQFDHLTDLLTRRQFIGAVERLITASTVPATLCVCNIDFFRGVNDSYGPLAGDQVLRAFAEILRRTLRQGDVIARLAADQFAVLFPGTSMDHCAPPMERVREQLAATRFPGGGDTFSVTASFGLAAWCGTGDAEWWIEAAERALAENRRNRRNHALPGSFGGDL